MLIAHVHHLYKWIGEYSELNNKSYLHCNSLLLLVRFSWKTAQVLGTRQLADTAVQYAKQESTVSSRLWLQLDKLWPKTNKAYIHINPLRA